MQFDSRWGWGAMHGGGLVWTLIAAVVIVVPFWRLLPRFGIPSWVALVAVFPLAAVVLLWVMAFSDRLSGKAGAR
ncbi:MAG: hypothetical protein V4753_09340 [Pseudomonadota bacterium]